MRLIDADKLQEEHIKDYGKRLLLIDVAPTVETFTKDDMAGAYNEGYACGSRESERPKGEWKVYGKQGGIPITDMCSNCRYEMKWYKNKYNFCPNCGAKMEGGAE